MSRNAFRSRHAQEQCARCEGHFAADDVQTFGVGRDQYCSGCIDDLKREEPEADEDEDDDECPCRGGCSRCTGVRGTCF